MASVAALATARHERRGSDLDAAGTSALRVPRGERDPLKRFGLDERVGHVGDLEAARSRTALRLRRGCVSGPTTLIYDHGRVGLPVID
jgi:hypothetical protein